MYFPSLWCVSYWSSDDVFFFFKKKTAYVLRISDWSSDVCSSALQQHESPPRIGQWQGVGQRKLCQAGRRRMPLGQGRESGSQQGADIAKHLRQRRRYQQDETERQRQ